MLCVPSPAVRPFAGGVPRRAAAAPPDASERGKKRPRVAPARDSSACLTKMSSQELLQKRLASELDALRGLLKKAELISQRGACKSGAPPTAGKKERFLACNQRPKPIEEVGCNAPSVKRTRKVSSLVEQKQKQIPTPPRMSQEERNQLFGRLSSLSGEVPGHIVEFFQKQFGDADAHGEIEINIDSVEDAVLFELKTHLDKLAEESKDSKLAEESKDSKLAVENKDSKVAEESKDDKVAEESKGEVVLVQQSIEANKVQDVQRAAPKTTVSMAALIYRAKVRRELLEMERAALPDESIHPRGLQRLGIAEYGHPSLMRQLGLVLKVDA